MNQEIRKQLSIGEDEEARGKLSDGLESIISESSKGEIALAVFIERLERVLKEAKEYAKAFNNNYKE